MDVHAKIGTGPGKFIHIYRKRKLPRVGEVILFKRHPIEKYGKWERGRVDEIRDIGGRPLVCLSLW